MSARLRCSVSDTSTWDWSIVLLVEVGFETHLANRLQVRLGELNSNIATLLPPSQDGEIKLLVWLNDEVIGRVPNQLLHPRK